MDNSAKKKLASDIENQLDDFFGEKSPSTAPSAASYSLEKLKSAVLSIDWEITDACLTDLIEQSDALLPHFKNDPITHALLRMLRALGRYIRKRKARSHQDAIKRIMSVFSSLETLINDKQLDEDQRKRIVAKEIQAFKKLKEQVETQRTVKYADVAPSNPETREPADNELGRLSAEVKELKAKVATLQNELNSIRKSS